MMVSVVESSNSEEDLCVMCQMDCSLQPEGCISFMLFFTGPLRDQRPAIEIAYAIRMMRCSPWNNLSSLDMFVMWFLYITVSCATQKHTMGSKMVEKCDLTLAISTSVWGQKNIIAAGHSWIDSSSSMQNKYPILHRTVYCTAVVLDWYPLFPNLIQPNKTCPIQATYKGKSAELCAI